MQMSSNMEKEAQRHGFTKGLKAPRINDDYKKVSSFAQSYTVPNIYAKTMTENTVKRKTKDFYSALFSLHDVHILPAKYDPIFNKYLNSAAKTTEGFISLIEKYAIVDSPFLIPTKQEVPFQDLTGILTYFADGLDESKIPIINNKIVMSPYTNLSPSFYANFICSTQLDRIKGSVPSYHDREVLSILMEKISAYQSHGDIFSKVERFRIIEFKKATRLIEISPQNNFLWSFYISTIKAEELFDHYISLSQDDKKAFLGDIQRIFDGEINLDDLLNSVEISLEADKVIPTIKRNLSIH